MDIGNMQSGSKKVKKRKQVRKLSAEHNRQGKKWNNKDKKLSQDAHINEKTYRMLGLIVNTERAFIYAEENMVKKTIKTIIIPTLEYFGWKMEKG